MPRLDYLFGPGIWSEISGRTVIDFGCGSGNEAIELAQHGAARVIGLDIREDLLRIGRQKVKDAGVNNVSFATSTTETGDIMISIDAFEHFDDAAAILHVMEKLLNPGGKLFVSWGPPWYHPLGGHLFSKLPWMHLLLPERFLCWVRSFYRNDGAKRFREVAGGLNRMTIRRFEKLIEDSPFVPRAFECVPIKAVRRLHSNPTREFLTSAVRCELRRRQES